MNPAMWISKTGVQAQDAKLQAIANNLANVNTDGFKGERVFARLLNGLDALVGKGRYVVALSSDHGVMPLPAASNSTARGSCGQAKSPKAWPSSMSCPTARLSSSRLDNRPPG